MKLSNKKLIELVNEMFSRLELNNYEAFEAYSTKYRNQDYERGAATMIVRFSEKGDTSPQNSSQLICLYWRKDLENELNKGKVLGLAVESIEFGLVNAEIIPILPKKPSNSITQ